MASFILGIKDVHDFAQSHYTHTGASRCFIDFCTSNGFCKVQGIAIQNLGSLFGYRKELDYSENGFSSMPRMDHGILLRDVEYRKAAIAYHPYLSPDTAIDVALTEVRTNVDQWAMARDLRVEVFRPEYSWYNPGATCLVLLTKSNLKVQAPNRITNEKEAV